ncbi:MAG: glycoside hydrolase family 97 catalytic domain-containing protein [Prevotella sp.]|nr:glycoside hydrolase family 97 catalytic domain-containing protein [Prevotella sp.]
MKKYLLLMMAWFAFSGMMADSKRVVSPDGNLSVSIACEQGVATYQVEYDGAMVIHPSALGLKTSIGDLTKGLSITGVRESKMVKSYQMTRTKASNSHFVANQLDVDFVNGEGVEFSVTFLVDNHNIAFRYTVPRQKDDNPKRAVVYSEASAFNFPHDTETFLCPQIGPETGWEHTKPSYEEEYEADAKMNKASKYGRGYTFPCLFKVPDRSIPLWQSFVPYLWVLVSETGVSSAYCGSHLSDYQQDRGYTVAYPDEGENGGFGSPYAAIALPGNTPWRTITVGRTLNPIVETTISYDVVEPQYMATEQYRPGRYTWSWLLWQDKSVNYDDQVRFIDLASAMGYEYCLVDNWWDKQIGRERMAELSQYAQQKGVSLMLWYNSNGYANDAPQTPRQCMNTAIAREREMKWLKSIGVKGIKVDFFGGDKQETMRLYEDILSDANRYGLQVIFHGCTLPRGWERMYPNYVGSEAVLASENLFFTQDHCDKEGFELTMHPFVRNAVASMDWGGVIMNRRMSKDNASRHYRRTGDVFEMATGITNQCSINCIAIQPNNLDELPQFEIDFLKQIPTTWDETCFIDGYPGRYVVMARRNGDNWYVAALNGTNKPITLPSLDLSPFFTSSDALRIYLDEAAKKGKKAVDNLLPTPTMKPLKPNGKGMLRVTLQPMGGMIICK